MAGRKDKNTVDYFPHYCISGKTMFIIENKFGHIGYSVWFKTLEILGQSENHYIDLRDETDLLYLISKLKITEEQFKNIYDLLAKLNAIDSYLWSKKIIYSDNFIKNIADAYKRRANKCMHKLDLCKHLLIKCSQKPPDEEHKPLEESKENKRKGNKQPTYSEFSDYAKEKAKEYNLIYNDNSLKQKFDAWKVNNWKDGNNKKIVNWKSKLLNTLKYIFKESNTITPFTTNKQKNHFL